MIQDSFDYFCFCLFIGCLKDLKIRHSGLSADQTYISVAACSPAEALAPWQAYFNRRFSYGALCRIRASTENILRASRLGWQEVPRLHVALFCTQYAPVTGSG